MALALKAAEVHGEVRGAALAKAERSALLSDHVGVCGGFFTFFIPLPFFLPPAQKI